MRLSPLNDILWDKMYYHDMKLKGFYNGLIDKGMPIYYLNGKYPVLFHITTINYALGLLFRFYDGENVKQEIVDIFYWLIDNQQDDGSWRYNFPEGTGHLLSDNKPSGMTQGLAISFIIRVLRSGLICNNGKYDIILDKAVSFMLSKEIVDSHKAVPIIEEFYSPGSGVLNGFIFALYGLYDYSKYKSDYKEYNKFLLNLKSLLPRYCFFFCWSKYSLAGTISSRFYHQLHIDMMVVLYSLTHDMLFKKYEKRWLLGMKFSALFVLIKSFQKVFNIDRMVMSYSYCNNSEQ